MSNDLGLGELLDTDLRDEIELVGALVEAVAGVTERLGGYQLDSALGLPSAA
ncbi:MAG: hypothetical protein M3Y71_03260 [Actinomycetota bacterium]|nr:hypothetical protein [Actinomycetota bacterium]